jgi:hypothetical protein
MGKNNANMAAVTVLRSGGSQTFETTDTTQLKKLQAWLDEVNPTQPPPEKIGAVIPWCKITFYEAVTGKSNPISTNSIYSVRDRTTGYRLLRSDQKERLLDIFGQKLEE